MYNQRSASTLALEDLQNLIVLKATVRDNSLTLKCVLDLRGGCMTRETNLVAPLISCKKRRRLPGIRNYLSPAEEYTLTTHKKSRGGCRIEANHDGLYRATIALLNGKIRRLSTSDWDLPL